RATLHTGSGIGSCAPTFANAAAYDCTAGPRIIGGNGLLSLNAEFRFPIAGPFQGALFYEASQVWKNFSDVNFRFEGNDGLRQSAGIGLRILLPIGPLRADFGFPLRRRTIPYNITAVDPNCTAKDTASCNTIILGSGTVKEKGNLFFF